MYVFKGFRQTGRIICRILLQLRDNKVLRADQFARSSKVLIGYISIKDLGFGIYGSSSAPPDVSVERRN
jgi:hypothetical protein